MSKIDGITVFTDDLKKRPDLPECGATEGHCPSCGTELKTGFGLAGGGYGVYEYCDNETCNDIITKSEVLD